MRTVEENVGGAGKVLRTGSFARKCLLSFRDTPRLVRDSTQHQPCAADSVSIQLQCGRHRDESKFVAGSIAYLQVMRMPRVRRLWQINRCDQFAGL